MLCRTGVFVVVVLSLTMSANAQEGEPPALGQAAAATDAHDVPPPKKPDRVFGVLPNYGTVEDATEASIVTTKATFRMAALNAFDPYGRSLRGSDADPVGHASDVGCRVQRAQRVLAGHSAKDASRVTVHLSLNRYL